jgi:hypothetical protein
MLIACAASMQASVIENISFNLSSLHAGSTLSGTFALSDTPVVGDTAPVTLSFSDPADYSVASLAATITIGTGTPSGETIMFSALTFTNLGGVTSPIDTKDIDLMGFSFAKCTSFPCTASGGFEDRSPAVFTSTYTVTPAAAVPEPSVAFLIPVVLIGMVFSRRFLQSA